MTAKAAMGPKGLTDINDLGKVGCPRTVSGCAYGAPFVSKIT